MNSLEIIREIEYLDRGISPLKLTKESEDLLRKLFEITSVIKPVGEDDRKEFWLHVDRCSLEEYREYYKDSYDDADKTDEEWKKEYNREFPEEKVWIRFISVAHSFRGEFKAVFLNNSYVLNIGDVNALR